MILTCPSCATRYMADSATFQPSGRMVRCAGCSHSWYQEPAEDFTLLALPDPAGPSYVEASELTTNSDRSRRMLTMGRVAGWLILVLAMSSVIFGGYQYRVQIVKLWPQAATLYAALDMPVNVHGLVFRQANYSRQVLNGNPVLAVKGTIQNATGSLLIVPRIHIALRDKDQRLVVDWTIDAPVVELAPFESAEFATQLDNPPGEARDLVIAFAGAKS